MNSSSIPGVCGSGVRLEDSVTKNPLLDASENVPFL